MFVPGLIVWLYLVQVWLFSRWVSTSATPVARIVQVCLLQLHGHAFQGTVIGCDEFHNKYVEGKVQKCLG